MSKIADDVALKSCEPWGMRQRYAGLPTAAVVAFISCGGEPRPPTNASSPTPSASTPLAASTSLTTPTPAPTVETVPDAGASRFKLEVLDEEAGQGIAKFMATRRSGECAVERWDVKIGTDTEAGKLSLAPSASKPITIAALRGFAVPGALGLHTPRFAGVEHTVYDLRDVRLVCFKHEGGAKGDGDYHVVLEDAADAIVSDDDACARLNPKDNDISVYSTVIVEIPDPRCLKDDNPWKPSIKRVRDLFDTQYAAAVKPQRVDRIISVRGVGFFDVLHGQLGVAPNGIELHPVVDMCFDKGCKYAH